MESDLKSDRSASGRWQASVPPAGGTAPRQPPLSSLDVQMPGDDVVLDLSRRVIAVLGLPFDEVDMSEARGRIQAAARSGRRCIFTTPNLNFAAMALHDAPFRASVLRSSLSLADGTPLVWLSRLMGSPLPERVAGSDLFEALADEPLAPRQLRVYFFGGPPGAAEAACEAVNARSLSVKAVGCFTPGFGSIESMSSDETIDAINRCRPDFVIVALGARKGQEWIDRNRPRLSAPVISHLGAVVNFTAGRVSRAPKWARSAGLEWCWRILNEPALWRRYWGDARVVGRALLRDVLPWKLSRLLGSHAPGHGGPATFSERREDGVTPSVVFRLAGQWTDQDATTLLRPRLAQALRQGAAVRLDLSQGPELGAPIIGLAMLVAGCKAQVGPVVLPDTISHGAVRRALRAHGALGLAQG